MIVQGRKSFNSNSDSYLMLLVVFNLTITMSIGQSSFTYVGSTPGYIQSYFTTATTLGSLLLAAIDRARGKANATMKPLAGGQFKFENPMSRKPLRQLSDSFVSKTTQAQKLSKKFTYEIENEEIPQKVVTDSMPIVHERLPDPALWAAIKEKLSQEEQLSISSKNKLASTRKDPLNKSTKHSSLIKTVLKSSTSKPSRVRRNILKEPQLEGVLRRRQLYCRTGYHLQILPNGKVAGTPKDHNKYAILEFMSVGVKGLVGIRGVESGKYLAMNSKGQLYGTNDFTSENVFQEVLQENWYNTYSSFQHRNNANTRPCYLALGKKGRPRHGCKAKAKQRYSHFLPRPVDSEKVPHLYKGILY